MSSGGAIGDTETAIMETKMGDGDMVTGPRVRQLAEIDTACASSRLVLGLTRLADPSNVASLAEKRAERNVHRTVNPESGKSTA